MDVKKYTLRRSAPPPRVDFGDALDAEQRQVVEAPPGYVLAVAGAGSGKTRALTHRVARLILQGTPPERLLLCTFTNRAAREMTRRVQELADVELRGLWAGTFHHVGNRILRQHADRLGLSPDYSILDRGDATDLMGRVVAERAGGRRTARFPQPGLLLSMISSAANTMVPLSTVLEGDYARFVHQQEAIAHVAEAYAEKKRQLNLLDFDDLLGGWLTLLQEHPDVAEQLQQRFLHVLVDEYQDVNRLQATLTDAMALGHDSLTVVGDDDQSIYAFRGAWPDAMLRFSERHPTAQIHRIQSNYRSRPEVLRLANASISHNRRRHEKQLRPVRSPGTLPVVVSVQDVYQQAAFVAQRVLELHEDEGLPLSAMAVLYRAHAHSLELQVELTRRQIPFTVRAGLRFFEQAHIKDALAHLRWQVNPLDELAGMRVLRLLPGVGAATATRVLQHLAQRPPACLSAGLRATLSASGITGRGRAQIKALVPLFEGLDAQPAPGPALRTVGAGPYREIALGRYANAETRLEDLGQLADFADPYEDAGTFLQEISLMAGMAAEGFQPGEPPDDQLTLSTVHQAKGLEWDAVFVLWLCEGHFPSAMALRDPDGEEEERRLFHVAATRARNHLTLVHPILAEQGGLSRVLTRPSRLLVELDAGPAAPGAGGDAPAELFERWRVEEAYEDDAEAENGLGPTTGEGGAGNDPIPF